MNHDDTPSTSRSKLDRTKQAFYLVVTIIGVGVILWALGMILGKVSDALSVVAISLVLTFFLHSPVNFFEKKGIPRVWGTLLAFIIALVVLTVLGIVIGPLFGDQISAFALALPGYVDQIMHAIEGIWNDYGYLLSNDMILDWIKDIGAALSQMLSSLASNTASGVLGLSLSVGNGLVVVIMSIVASFWILMDLPRMGREIRVMIGPKYIEDVMVVVQICSRVASGYVKGVCIASCCTGIIAGTGFAILGMPYAAVLGLIIGIMNIIPYIGPWVGGAIAALIGLFVSPLTAIIAIIITVVAQQFTDTFITPRVMSTTVDIHPVLVIVVLIAGGAVGGIVGMIVAVPLAAALKAIYVYYFEKKTGRKLVTEDGAFFKGIGNESAEVDPKRDASDSVGSRRSSDTTNEGETLVAGLINKVRPRADEAVSPKNDSDTDAAKSKKDTIAQDGSSDTAHDDE